MPQRMNCWRTTWGGTLNSVGTVLSSIAVGDAVNLIPIPALNLSPDWQSVLFIAGMILRTVGGQWQAMASADNSEVKRHLNLNPDGTKKDGEPDPTPYDGTR